MANERGLSSETGNLFPTRVLFRDFEAKSVRSQPMHVRPLVRTWMDGAKEKETEEEEEEEEEEDEDEDEEDEDDDEKEDEDDDEDDDEKRHCA